MGSFVARQAAAASERKSGRFRRETEQSNDPFFYVVKPDSERELQCQFKVQ
jgi:hypothetical protein